MNAMAKSLILVGSILVLVGIIAVFFDKVPGLGKLPGDFHIRKNSFSFYFPLTTCVILSLILTLLFSIFGKK